jgi:hypothetical protein
MKRTVACESFDGCNLAPFGAKCRHQAAVDGFAVKPDCACAAVACIAAFFYAKPAEIACERTQALAGPWLSVKSLSVDFVAHRVF